MKQFYAVWFQRNSERTAKLILDTEKFPKPGTTIEAYSKLFPVSHFNLMRQIRFSEFYNTWSECFEAEAGRL